MMDNELPWQPPNQQKVTMKPQISPSVPDLTIFSPNNKAPVNKQNFLQRAIANEKVLNNIPKNNPKNFSNVKPSVPDVSLLDSPVLIPPTNRQVKPTTSRALTNVYPKRSQSSKENVFGFVGKPSVPDLTILDELKPVKPVSASSDRVFNESYKKMIAKSHEKFMKQINDSSPTQEAQENQPKKKSGLFNPERYQENPLRKYAPAPRPQTAPQTYEKDANSSSILVEFGDVAPAPAQPEDKTDEMTFKKVAEMLNEIQRLVVPGKTVEEDKPKTKLKPHVILRHLAEAYLSQQELECYDIEQELNELEKTES